MRERTKQPAPVDLESLRRREPSAVEAWFHEHADALYTFVFYRVDRDEHVATDVVQETFLTAMDKLGDFDPGRGTMRAWLTFVSRNPIQRETKRRNRVRTAGGFWDDVDQKLLEALRAIEKEPLPEDALTRAETTELVHMAMANIPDKYGRVLSDHYYDDRTLSEIATTECITEGAAKSLLHRARLAFKAAFETLTRVLDEPRPQEGTAR